MSAHVEEARIARLRRIFTQGDAQGIEVDVGDDAAVLAPSLGREVLSVDAHVEHVHFRRAWLSSRELGARAAMAALSDLAAMGAEPRVVLLSLALSDDVTDEELEALALGVRDACDETGARVVGGNLARASEISIHTTVIGRMTEAPLRRDGAKVGDGVYVTGTLGAAALGLAALEAGRSDTLLAPFVARWRRPRARVSEGRRLIDLASAAIDVSDGLALDLSRLAEASGVGIDLDAKDLPLEPDHAACAALLSRDPITLALIGGEDYELAFTAPLSRALAGLATRIGSVVARPGVVATDASGRPLEVAGFDHFARRATSAG
ncbi:MAG: thiamine-phosphate kinase [Deltaproteobacteria bacterium]|nr:thiamine-phosphate kinase [Deltaproteobacteria bacterium]